MVLTEEKIKVFAVDVSTVWQTSVIIVYKENAFWATEKKFWLEDLEWPPEKKKKVWKGLWGSAVSSPLNTATKTETQLTSTSWY